MKYEVAEIRLDDIDASGRARDVTAEAAEGLAAEIENDGGLRSPIEVSPVKGGAVKYRLTYGGHRVAAFRILGLETIPAFVRTQDELAQRRSELMENVGRNELSALELATFLAELKRVEQAITGAKHGGDRRGKNRPSDQDVKMTSWFETMGKIRRKSSVTIQKYVAIGERLSDDSVARLRGTVFEERRGELDALGKYGWSVQAMVVNQLLAEDNAAPTVKSAVKRIEGHPDEAEADAAGKAFKKLLDAWNRAPKKVQDQFLSAINASVVL